MDSTADLPGQGRALCVVNVSFRAVCDRAWRQKAGRVASLEDLVHARLAQDWTTSNIWVASAWDLHDPNLVFDRYYTSRSAVFRGVGKEGRRLFLVAHDLHPFDFAPDEALTADAFLDLEAGRYGAVRAFDLAEVQARFDACYGQFNLRTALAEPFLLAVLGREAEAYLRHHHVRSLAWVERPGGERGVWATEPPAEPQLLSFDLYKFLKVSSTGPDPVGGHLFLGPLTKGQQQGSRYRSLQSELEILTPSEDAHRLVLVSGDEPLVAVTREENES